MTVPLDMSPEALRARARDAVGGLSDRAAERVASRLAKQPEPFLQPPGALLPAAIDQAEGATMNAMNDDLDFLNPPPPPRPADVLLDDAGLALAPTLTGSAVAGGEAQTRHKKKLEVEQEGRDRDQAMLDMQTAIRTMSVKELLDLKSNVPPFVLTAAMIERLIGLMVRLLTLGLVKRVDNLSDALGARQQLQQLAEAELDRRRRLPATLADRKEALREYGAAVEWRSKALNERRTLRSMPDPRAHEHRERRAADLRQQIEVAFDQKRVVAGLETIKTRRAAHDDARAEHRRVRAENDKVPAGFAGLLITRAQRDAAAAAKVAAALMLKNAAARREAAKEQLQLLLDEIEQAAVVHEQHAAEEAAAAEKAEARERELLAKELRALPEQLREIGAAAQRERVGQRAAELVVDANRPKSTAEIEAAEAERLRQLDMANRRG